MIPSSCQAITTVSFGGAATAAGAAKANTNAAANAAKQSRFDISSSLFIAFGYSEPISGSSARSARRLPIRGRGQRAHSVRHKVQKRTEKLSLGLWLQIASPNEGISEWKTPKAERGQKTSMSHRPIVY
jgi:hypothetical protein